MDDDTTDDLIHLVVTKPFDDQGSVIRWVGETLDGIEYIFAVDRSLGLGIAQMLDAGDEVYIGLEGWAVRRLPANWGFDA